VLTAALATLAVIGGQLVGAIAAAMVLEGTAWDTKFGKDVISLASPVGVGVTIASQATSIVFVWLFAGRGGLRREVLQLLGPSPGSGTLLAGGLIAIIVTGLIELLLYTGLGFDYRTDVAWLADGLRSPLWPATVLIAVILAPFWEELTFRGFLLSALAQTPLGFWGGAVISNVAWTALHGGYTLPGMASVFTAGLVLSWLLLRTGSIRAPIAAHAIANAFAVAFAYWVSTGP
jgi:membrane protease YdiL (CAAX protease family)